MALQELCCKMLLLAHKLAPAKPNLASFGPRRPNVSALWKENDVFLYFQTTKFNLAVTIAVALLRQ